MSRGISAALLNALGTDHIQPFFAVELMFDTAPLRLWTGISNRVINVQGADQTFIGTGSLLSLSGVDEVYDLSAKSVSLRR